MEYPTDLIEQVHAAMFVNRNCLPTSERCSVRSVASIASSVWQNMMQCEDRWDIGSVSDSAQSDAAKVICSLGDGFGPGLSQDVLSMVVDRMQTEAESVRNALAVQSSGDQ